MFPFVPYSFCQPRVPAQKELVLPMLDHQNTKVTENRRIHFSSASLEDITMTTAFLWHVILCTAFVQEKQKARYILKGCWLVDSMLPTRRCICQHRGHDFTATSVHCQVTKGYLWFRSVMDTWQLQFCWINENIHFRVYTFRPARRWYLIDHETRRTKLSHLFGHIENK